MNSVVGDVDALDPRQIAHWKKLTPGQRLDRAMALMRQVRRFQAACVRAQHPDWDDVQVAAELRRRWLFAHHADLARGLPMACLSNGFGSFQEGRRLGQVRGWALYA